MSAAIPNHIALRVADLDAAIGFYSRRRAVGGLHTVTGDARPDLDGETATELSAVHGDRTCCTADTAGTADRDAKAVAAR